MRGRPPAPREAARLLVDPLRCDGVRICAHVAARVVDLDTWGYPIVPDRGLDRREQRSARAAVAACPRRALLLTAAGEPVQANGLPQASGAPPVTPST